MSDHHWYATTRSDWVVADTKENVLKKLARVTDTEWFKDGGVEALVCKVNLPITARYSMEEYLPVNVEREPAQRVRLLNRQGKFEDAISRVAE